MTNQSTQIRDDAMSVLRDVLGWSLPPARWDDVDATLNGLGSGLDLVDPDQLSALTKATIALELAGPVRTTKIDKSAIPAPRTVRDRVNKLLHELAQPERVDDVGGDAKAGR